MRSLLPLALLFIAFTVPSIAQKSESATAATATSEVVVREGAPLTVECSLRVEQRAEWRVDGLAPAGDLRAAGERPGAGGGRLQARLSAPAARPDHAGLYTCAQGAGASAVRVRVLPGVPATETTPTNEAEDPKTFSDQLPTLIMFDLNQPLILNCSILPNVKYDWFSNDTELVFTTENQGNYKLEEGGSRLVINRMREDDWGNYSCKVAGGPVSLWSAHARAIARVPTDTNVVEGQKFSITCKLYGKPYPRVIWSYAPYENVNFTEVELVEKGRFTVRDSAAGVPGGVLEGTEAVSADAGLYQCEPPGGTKMHSTLRVKDVYAALWPFLGICLEVFILCAIILVYEKRRTKPEMEDSDADTHEQKKT